MKKELLREASDAHDLLRGYVEALQLGIDVREEIKEVQTKLSKINDEINEEGYWDAIAQGLIDP